VANTLRDALANTRLHQPCISRSSIQKFCTAPVDITVPFTSRYSSPEELEALITGKGLIEVNRDFGGGSMENRFFSLA
jgi:hypothetical protein